LQLTGAAVALEHDHAQPPPLRGVRPLPARLGLLSLPLGASVLGAAAAVRQPPAAGRRQPTTGQIDRIGLNSPDLERSGAAFPLGAGRNRRPISC
jgi:hypothetical protein